MSQSSPSLSELRQQRSAKTDSRVVFEQQLEAAVNQATEKVKELGQWLADRLSATPLPSMATREQLTADYLARAQEGRLATPSPDRVEFDGLSWLVDQFVAGPAIEAARRVLSSSEPVQGDEDLAKKANTATAEAMADRVSFIANHINEGPSLDFLVLPPQDSIAQHGALIFASENPAQRKHNDLFRKAFKVEMDRALADKNFQSLYQHQPSLALSREFRAHVDRLMSLREEAARRPSVSAPGH